MSSRVREPGTEAEDGKEKEKVNGTMEGVKTTPEKEKARAKEIKEERAKDHNRRKETTRGKTVN